LVDISEGRDARIDPAVNFAGAAIAAILVLTAWGAVK
jgi:hypothetical protein